MPVRTIVSIISAALGGICLIAGGALSLAGKGASQEVVWGVCLLTAQGFFVGFGLRELYLYLARDDKWGRTGAAVLCGILTGVGLPAAAIGNLLLVFADGPNAKLQLPAYALVLFGLGMSTTPGGLMYLSTSGPEAPRS